jgi:hypothetical protein
MGALEDAREAAAIAAASGTFGAVCRVAQLVDTGTATATISLDGSAPFVLPAILPGMYSGYTTVWVLCDPTQRARAVLVLGPAGVQADPPPTPSAPTSAVTAEATITPTWSGTWRVTRAAWDRWNVDRYGGRSDLYQGSDYGSGSLVGLATYGDQLVNLGATEITAIELSVQRNGSGGDAAVTVQGSPSGSPPGGAPSASGDTASSAVLSATGSGSIALPASLCEAMRTGAAKGLCTVGGTYAGAFGTSRSNGMALRVTYTRPA